MRELQSLGLDIGAYKIENLPDGQTRGIEVDLMSSSSSKRFLNRPIYESVLRENLENSLL
jgi:DNA-directed RNA polymerase subunit beta